MTNSAVLVTFPGNKVDLRLLASGAPGTVVTTGDGVGSAVTDRVPLTILTRRGKNALFAVVLEPLAAGCSPVVQSISATQANGAVCVIITHSAGQDTYRTKAPAHLGASLAPFTTGPTLP